MRGKEKGGAKHRARGKGDPTQRDRCQGREINQFKKAGGKGTRDEGSHHKHSSAIVEKEGKEPTH